jgi:hypothetical protein
VLSAQQAAWQHAFDDLQNLDLSGVAVLDPQLTRLPHVVQGGLMHMAGFFPSMPLQMNFELLFAPVEGKWQLFGISLNVGQATPSAPPPQPAPEAATPTAVTPTAAKKPPPPAHPATSPPRPTPPRARTPAGSQPKPAEATQE